MPWPDSLHSPAEDLADLLYYEATGADHSSSSPIPPSTFQLRDRRLPSLHPPRAAFAGLPPFSPPPPLNYQDTLRDVEHALHNADMALRNAQAAFRQGRMAQSRSNDVIDLTTSSEDANQDRFMSQTRHPHDADRISRPQNAMNEPPYGLPPLPHLQNHRSHSRMPSLRDLMENNEPNPRPPVMTAPLRSRSQQQAIEQATARAEASAVRRQRQARRDWERVERRNRLRAEQAARINTDERPHSSQQNSQNLSQGTNTSRSERRASNASNPSLRSNNSITYSLGSDSEDSVLDESQTSNRTAHRQPAAIDLTSVEDTTALSTILAKEQQDAIAAQMMSMTSSNDSKSVLQRYKCAICMDSPKDATSTACGHLFCHRCILDSLKWSERQRHENHPRHRLGLCPVCRKPLQQRDMTAGGSQKSGLIALEIKTMSRKEYMAKKQRKRENTEREDFLKVVGSKGKQRAQTEDQDLVKMEDEQEDKKPAGRAAGRSRAKRKRSDDARMKQENADVDLLFESPVD